MKLRFSAYLAIATASLALISIFYVHVSAQDKKGSGATPVEVQKAPPKALPDGGPPPRLPDGHPDLTGHWYPGFLGKEDATLVSSAATQGEPLLKPFDPKVTPEEKPSFQPRAIEKMKETATGGGADADDSGRGGTNLRNFQNLPKAQKIAILKNEILHLSMDCMPHGVPAMFLGAGHGMQLVQSAGSLVQLTELNHDFRLIPTDGREHSKDPDPAFNGEGVAHWDGDTLVIDTIAIDERAGVTQRWTLHSDQEHVIERISRPSLNYLNYQVTIEDPKVLTKPWHSVVHHYSLSHEALLEWYCGVASHNDEDIAAFQEEIRKLEEEK
jgi:hypothetical protein